MIPKPIRTPRGRRMTVRQYLALHAATSARNGWAPACEHGHFDCAAWDGGPCADELISNLEQEKE